MASKGCSRALEASKALLWLAVFSVEIFASSFPDPKIIREKMEKHKIIPDLHELFTFYIVEASFENNHEVDLGNEIPKNLTAHPPKVSWSYDDDAYYTLMMTDLDAPNPDMPHLREWQHWLIVNIPKDNVTAGETLSEYIAPDVQNSVKSFGQNFTGKHRYVLTCYRQPGDKPMNFDVTHLDAKSDIGRIMFSTHIFATDHDYGDPHAVNFFYVTHKPWHE